MIIKLASHIYRAEREGEETRKHTQKKKEECI